jgi:hypothetical protein
MALGAPAAVLGHALNPTYTSRLPLAVYLAGAGLTVALSFVFVLARDIRADLPAITAPAHLPPAIVRYGLRALGLVAWSWIVMQGILGGSGAGAVAPLFLWIYGWVGLALASAIIGPIRHWFDPFSTLHDLSAAVLRRLGIGSWNAAPYLARLRRWPAAIGFIGFVWLELVLAGAGHRSCSSSSSATPPSRSP